MERLSAHSNAPSGIGANMLRTWGLLFVTAGVIGRGILQTRMLGIGQISAQQLLDVMNSSQSAMVLATVSLVLQAMETCAVPIFLLLLTEGFLHTSDFKKYLLRVAGLALLSELPYNLALSGKLLAMNSRNPVFGLVLGLVMLYFYQRYPGRTLKNVLVKVMVTLAAMVWGRMLSIEYGSAMVLILCVLWTFRRKPLYRNFAGATAAVVCTMMSPFFLAAPMGFLAIHMYNGEKGNTSPIVNYLAYPAILLLTGIVGMVL